MAPASWGLGIARDRKLDGRGGESEAVLGGLHDKRRSECKMGWQGRLFVEGNGIVSKRGKKIKALTFSSEAITRKIWLQLQ